MMVMNDILFSLSLSLSLFLPSQEDDDEDEGSTPTNLFPAALTRRFEVRLLPPTNAKAVALRHVTASSIGKLVRLSGIVTRVTDVKPLVEVATYTCDQCGNTIF
jgi:DNA replication licensing factor MCM7